MASRQERSVVRLWDGLDDATSTNVDKHHVRYTPRFRSKLMSARFPHCKSNHFVPGVESVRRAFFGHRSPAQKPNLSRLVDAVCSQLVLKYRRPTTVQTAKGRLCIPKWQKVMDGYCQIKRLTDNSELIQNQTKMQLFNITLHARRILCAVLNNSLFLS